MMRIAEWEHQVAQTSLCEDAISIIRLCVQHFYGKDYVFERYKLLIIIADFSEVIKI